MSVRLLSLSKSMRYGLKKSQTFFRHLLQYPISRIVVEAYRLDRYDNMKQKTGKPCIDKCMVSLFPKEPTIMTLLTFYYCYVLVHFMVWWLSNTEILCLFSYDTPVRDKCLLQLIFISDRPIVASSHQFETFELLVRT